MNKQEKDFLNKVLLTNPETGEKMKIVKTEGAEKGLKCLRITVKGKTGGYRHRIYTTEI